MYKYLLAGFILFHVEAWPVIRRLVPLASLLPESVRALAWPSGFFDVQLNSAGHQGSQPPVRTSIKAEPHLTPLSSKVHMTNIFKIIKYIVPLPTGKIGLVIYFDFLNYI
ncbi:hypothetical protein F4804DRAFT_261941 [Jackrogersella minutella]|nr:hypothetical protein F4804DRAFT_261941 [Jackrogersella minutella]